MFLFSFRHIETIGGDAWESNPPGALLRPHTGFEDQAAHRNRRTSGIEL